MINPTDYLNWKLIQIAEENTETVEELDELVEDMIDEIVNEAYKNVVDRNLREGKHNE